MAELKICGIYVFDKTVRKRMAGIGASLLLPAIVFSSVLLSLSTVDKPRVEGVLAYHPVERFDTIGASEAETTLFSTNAISTYIYLPLVAKPDPYLPAGCVPEPNNTLSLSKGPLAPNRVYCGHPDMRDDPSGQYDYDYYFINVTNTGQISVTLQNEPLLPGYPPQNLLAIYTPNSALLDWCCTNPDRGFTRSLVTPITITGTYYLLVMSVDIAPALTYTLTWNLIPSNLP